MSRAANDVIFNDTAVSETITGDEVTLLHTFGYSVQIVATGSSKNGTVILECSNDKATWIEITATSTAITGTGTQAVMLNATDVFYKYVRVKLTADANAITLVATYNGKGV